MKISPYQSTPVNIVLKDVNIIDDNVTIDNLQYSIKEGKDESQQILEFTDGKNNFTIELEWLTEDRILIWHKFWEQGKKVLKNREF
jgi:hypothetical protein